MNKFLYIVVFSGVLLGAFSCAKIGSPYGGPKDEDPPIVLKTKPLANSVNFQPQKKIIILFDEYIEIADIYQEMILSPPIEGRILAQVKGKSLVITFPPEATFDTLTYTLDFGNSIKDYNEGNTLKNYQYIFSLKSYLDSLNVEGKTVSAFNHQPDKDRMYVMLYRNLNDSVPYQEKPDYICRTDEQGNFSLHNIEDGYYRIFALKDANFNMLFDLAEEKIAFSDSIIELTSERFQDNIIVDDTLFHNGFLNPDSLQYEAYTAVDSVTFSDTLHPDIISGSDSVRYEAYTAVDSADVSDTLFSHNHSNPYLIRYKEYDTLNFTGADSLVSDSLTADSLIDSKPYYSYYTELFFFTEDISNQYMTNYLRPAKEQLFFSFNETLADTFEVFPLNYAPEGPDWFLLDANRDMDTLKFWITDTAMFAKDSLQMEVCYPMYDTLGILYYQKDTLLMQMEQESTGHNRRGRTRRLGGGPDEQMQEIPEAPKIVLQNNIKNPGTFDIDKRIVIISPTPLERVLTDSIRLFRIQDTLKIPENIVVETDTNSMYKTYIQYMPEGNTMYEVFIPDSTVFDIYGTTNDTTEFRYKTQAEDYYGTLTINMNGVNTPLILQLLDDKEKVLAERRIYTNQSIRFEYLHPKKFFLKLIVDSNDNGEWDTGKYLEHIQPEKVIYYYQAIEIRSNWEMDFIWDVESE